MEEVIKTLQESFLGIDTSDLEIDPYSHRITGRVIWAGFEEKSQIDRQDMLWDALDARIPKDSRPSIGMILTLTPLEIAAYQENAA